MFLGQELLKAVQVFWQENVKGGSRRIAGAFNAYRGRKGIATTAYAALRLTVSTRQLLENFHVQRGRNQLGTVLLMFSQRIPPLPLSVCVQPMPCPDSDTSAYRRGGDMEDISVDCARRTGSVVENSRRFELEACDVISIYAGRVKHVAFGSPERRLGG